MLQTKPLDSATWVAAQVHPEDLPGLAAAGFHTLIGNRPDGEAPDQPLASDLAALAQQHGIAYVHLPVVAGAIAEADVDAFGQALQVASGPVLAFCRSGTRSATLWARWQARQRPLDEVLAATARAGYDLSSLRAQSSSTRGNA